MPRRRPSAFTLIEMMTTVAVLVIVLGLMVSLARDVRTRSAERLTKDLLGRLDTLVEQYRRPLRTLPEAQRKIYPIVRPLIDEAAVAVAGRTEEAALRSNANANNWELVRALKSHIDLSAGPFNDLSIANFNEVNVLDAWGSPIVYMPSQHPLVGMAAGDRSFFFSAGPDRKYLTRQDNLYSYEAGPSP
jgi:prepilin-type N-terminal cleavage/methylation domain-containing protein